MFLANPLHSWAPVEQAQYSANMVLQLSHVSRQAVALLSTGRISAL
jgi:hypothetical protein